MTISLIPVAVADPPAPPNAAQASRSGPSFGQYIDNADAQASGNATRARENAPSDRRRDDNSSASNGSTDQPAPQPATQAQAGSADRPADKAADRPHPADRTASSTSGKQGKRSAGGEDQPNSDKPAQPADIPAAATPVAIASITPPIATPLINLVTAADALPAGTDKAALPGTVALKADAAATGLSVPIGSHGKARCPWQATIAAAGAKADAKPGPAVASGATAPTAAQPLAMQQGDIEAPVKTAASTPATVDAPVLAPPVAGATTPALAVTPSATPAIGGLAKPRGSVSAPAAALLNRLTPNAAVPSQTPVTTAATAPVTGVAANSAAAIVRGVAAPTTSAPAAGSSDAAPGATAPSSGAPAAQTTPLPSLSAAVDLSAKFSAATLPEQHGEVAAVASKAKADLHAVTTPVAPAAIRPNAAPAAAAESTATAGAERPAADAPLAGTSALGSEVSGDDNAVAAPTVGASTTEPQPRGDIAALTNGAAPIVRAQELAAAPVAALHAVTEQVAISLKRGVKDGNDQIQINLEPASLGKIAVRLDFAQDGRVTATFSADRPDTLTLLNQDSRALEQSLRDAGLRADSGSLSFNLSGGDNGANARQFAQSASYAATAATMADNDPLAPLVAAPAIANRLSHDGSLDIHV
jgi:hypothetical protein